MMQVGIALGTDSVERHFQPDLSVDIAVTAMIALVVGVEDHDLVAEKPGGLRSPVRDQSLGLGQLQLELVTQEPSDLDFDLLCFPFGPVKPQGKSSAYAEWRVMPTVVSASLVGGVVS